MQWAQTQKGFTIVELLIVVVVIAILAAITIVSYVGITARSNDAAIQSSIGSMSKKLLADSTTDSTVLCNNGGGDDILATCLNSSPVFKSPPKAALASGTDVMRYYNSDASRPDPTIVGLSKSGSAFIFSGGSIKKITAAQYAASVPGCGGYGIWSATTQTWTTSYNAC